MRASMALGGEQALRNARSAPSARPARVSALDDKQTISSDDFSCQCRCGGSWSEAREETTDGPRDAGLSPSPPIAEKRTALPMASAIFDLERRRLVSLGARREESTLSAVERAILFVKEAIRRGHLVPGQRLTEPDLTQRLNVSRSSLREALRRLEAEGIVELQQFRGARVRQMSRADVLELCEIRAMLEGLAAAAAARRIDAAGRKALFALEREIDRSGRQMIAAYSDYNARFHDLIVELSGLAQLPCFIERTRLAVFRLQFDLILLRPERVKASRAEHRAIVKAIVRGAHDAAEAAMRRHIANTAVEILQAPAQYFME